MTSYTIQLQVQPIVEDVRQKGDAAVKNYTKRFDKVDLDTVCVPIEVSQPTKATLCHYGCTQQADVRSVSVGHACAPLRWGIMLYGSDSELPSAQ